MSGPIDTSSSIPSQRSAGRFNGVKIISATMVAERDRLGEKVTAWMHTLRYGAMPDDGAASLLHGVAGDINELLAKRPRLKVALLSDGAHDLVDQLAADVGGRIDRDVVQVVDFWHLVEKLAAAAPLLGDDAKHRLARWRLNLLNVEHAALRIRDELRASGREPVGDVRVLAFDARPTP